MKNNKQAFTLIELLVVVLIIGILAAVALPQYQLTVAKARYAKIVDIGDAIYRAEQVYFLEHGEYTATKMDLILEIKSSDVYLTSTYVVVSTPIPGGSIGYVRYLRVGYTNRRECRSIDKNEIGNKVCQHVTGDSGTNRTDSTGKSWKEFVYPNKHY